MIPTPSQDIAHSKFCDWLTTQNPIPFAIDGGAGCVHPDTCIHTEHGLKRISDLSEPTRVLSWNAKDQKFQLSLCGGSFPKGRGTLYRIATQYGEFQAIGHHLVLLSTGAYVPVEKLSVGDVVSVAQPSLSSSIEESCLSMSHEDGQRYMQTDVDSLRSYAESCRQYDPLPHEVGDYAPFLGPLAAGAPESDHSYSPSPAARQGIVRSHSHPCLCDGHTCKSDCEMEEPCSEHGEAGHTSASSSVCTSCSHQVSQQSQKLFECHHIAGQCVDSAAAPQDSLVGSCKTPVGNSEPILSSTSPILSISKGDDSEYWCMQVLDTHNYVCESGNIHHNSGKTYTLMNLIMPELMARRADFILTSTTHQANQMLTANLLATTKEGEPPSTLHSFLGLQPTTQKQLRNPKGFEQCGYKMRNKFPSRETFILVIDEAYRIDRTLYEIIIYLFPMARLVLIGDPFQVPPVGEQRSYLEEIQTERVLLLESPRFINGGSLGRVVTDLRLSVESNSNNYWDIITSVDDAHIQKGSRSGTRTLVNDLVDTNQPIKDSEFVLLSGTKKGEAAYNDYIMRRRGDAGHDLVHAGEPFTIETVIEASYEEQSDSVAALRKQRQFDHRMINADWEACKYGLYTQYDANTVLILITPWATRTAHQDFIKLVANARKKGHDIVFMRLNIARTIHLAQGLTSQLVLLDSDTVQKWANHNMRRRLLYTGTSRAAKKFIHF